MTATTHKLEFPGATNKRGFWLYVWRIESPAESIQLQADSSYCATQEEHWLSPYTALKALKTCASPM